MKTTSTIANKYPGHNTQKTAFPLCAQLLDTPNRTNANFRKMDTTTFQVDVIDNAKLKEGYRFSIRYFIHIAVPIWYRVRAAKPTSSPPATAVSPLFTGLGTDTA